MATSTISHISERHSESHSEAKGEIIEGWPIGYYEYEYASHKNIQDRFKMASIATKELKCMREADIVLVDSFSHPDIELKIRHDQQQYKVETTAELESQSQLLFSNNPFLNLFGAWPDQAFCLDSEAWSYSPKYQHQHMQQQSQQEQEQKRSPCVLLFRGNFLQEAGEEYGGCRLGTFTEDLERICF